MRFAAMLSVFLFVLRHPDVLQIYICCTFSIAIKIETPMCLYIGWVLVGSMEERRRGIETQHRIQSVHAFFLCLAS